jgi:hypothetical protein
MIKERSRNSWQNILLLEAILVQLLRILKKCDEIPLQKKSSLLVRRLSELFDFSATENFPVIFILAGWIKSSRILDSWKNLAFIFNLGS